MPIFSYLLPIHLPHLPPGSWPRSLPSWEPYSWVSWWVSWWPWGSVWSSSSTSPRGRRSPFCGASRAPPSIGTWSRKAAAPSSRASLGLWVDYGFTLDWLWIYYGFTMDLLWIDYGLTMDWLWVYYGFTMGLLWIDYGLTMDLLWFTMVSYEIIMG